MAYTLHPTVVTGQTWTAANQNTYVKDNLAALWVYTTAGDMSYATSSSVKARLALVPGGVLYGGASAPAYTPAGTLGQQLFSAGTGAPVWGTGERFIPMYLNNDFALVTGDYQGWFPIPSAFNGWNVSSVLAMRSSGTGVPSFQLRRIRSGASTDILSTQCTIDSGEVTSATAATPAVINTSNDDLATGDILAVDVDAAGTSSLKVAVLAGISKT